MKDSWIDKNELDDLVSGFARPSNGNQGAPPHQGTSSEDLFDDFPPFQPPQSRSPHVGPQYLQQPPAQPTTAEPSSTPQTPFPPQTASPPVTSHPVEPLQPSPIQRLVNRRPSQPAPPVPDHPPVESPFSLDLDKDELDETEESPPPPPPPKSGDATKPSSPFSVGDGGEFEGVEDKIETLAVEAARALKVLQEVRSKAEKNGLLGRPKDRAAGETETVSSEPQDRIPLDVEIDSHLSLKGRMTELARILEKYVGMEDVMIVDREGFALFATSSRLGIEKPVQEFVKSIRRVYDSEKNARHYTASQLKIAEEKWLCLVPTDGEIEGKFVLKGLVSQPLDRPEIYVLVELLNEVLRPGTV